MSREPPQKRPPWLAVALLSAAALGYEELQRTLLEAEGVDFDGRGRIDLERFGWP